MEKHLPYFALKSAFQSGECPLCHLMRHDVRRHLEHLFYELVNDPPTRQRIIASSGYCAVHTEQARAHNDLLGFSIVWQHVLYEAHKHIGGQRKKKLPCLACEIAAQTERDFVDVLCTGLRENEFREDYEQSWGLCLPHVEKVAARATPEVWQFVKVTEATIASRLDFQLSEIIRKHDYRFSHEGLGENVKARDVAAWKSSGCYEAALPQPDKGRIGARRRAR